MKNKTFIRRFGFAWNGILATIKGEASFRFQCLAVIGVIALLVSLRATPIWWAMMGVVSGGVLSAELLNTALEHLIDRLHPEIHPKIKLAKDCAAAAVFVFSFMSLVVLASLLFEKYLA
jgi:diacylglycerol kinase (ATP)